MGKITVHMQSTLNNRIADAEGVFWEPFPWGDPEQAYVNDFFRGVEAWVLSRVMYEVIVPWWDQVAAGQVPEDAPGVSPVMREFAEIQHGLSKVVFSRTLPPGEGYTVMAGDLPARLAALKVGTDGDLLLSCGAKTLGPLAGTPGLIDEYLVVIHPAVLAAGPGMFEHLDVDLALDLVEAKVFDAGAVVLRYAVRTP